MGEKNSSQADKTQTWFLLGGSLQIFWRPPLLFLYGSTPGNLVPLDEPKMLLTEIYKCQVLTGKLNYIQVAQENYPYSVKKCYN